MADTDATPMTNADTAASPTTHTAAPRENGSDVSGAFSAKAVEAKQAIKDGADKYGAKATDKIRTLADTGKERATGALSQVSTLLTDAAGQVDDKFGAQYGDYARTAASSLSSFSDQVANKNVDELAADAREFVRNSPAVALGVAAAVGFALARLVHSGIDSDKA